MNESYLNASPYPPPLSTFNFTPATPTSASQVLVMGNNSSMSSFEGPLKIYKAGSSTRSIQDSGGRESHKFISDDYGNDTLYSPNGEQAHATRTFEGHFTFLDRNGLSQSTKVGRRFMSFSRSTLEVRGKSGKKYRWVEKNGGRFDCYDARTDARVASYKKSMGLGNKVGEINIKSGCREDGEIVMLAGLSLEKYVEVLSSVVAVG